VTIESYQLSYTPPTDYNGDVFIIYGISDGNGGSDQAKLTLSITPNMAPLVINEQSQLNQGESVRLNLLANDSDPENDHLTLISVDDLAVSFNETGQAIFSAEADYFGQKVIEYTVEDSAGNQVIGQWQVTVIQVHEVTARTTGGGSLGHLLLFLWLISVIRYTSIGVESTRLKVKGIR